MKSRFDEVSVILTMAIVSQVSCVIGRMDRQIVWKPKNKIRRHSFLKLGKTYSSDFVKDSVLYDSIVSLRAGDSSDDEDESTDEDDSSSSYDLETSDYSDYDEESTENEMENADEIEISLEPVQYDEPLVPNSMNSMMTVVGAMMILRRFDMNEPKVIRAARTIFLVYTICVMAFAAFVRFMARRKNDETPVVVENPVTELVKNQINNAMSGSSSSDTVKGLADKFLTKVTNVKEYDVQQSFSLQNSMLFPLVILWIMHFKMGQVQPLLMQVATGVSNLMYHPLVQVYVMGRDLERPFKKPIPTNLQQNIAEDSATKEEEQDEKSTEDINLDEDALDSSDIDESVSEEGEIEEQSEEDVSVSEIELLAYDEEE